MYYQELNGAQIEKRDLGRDIALLLFGSVEVHGRNLPLSTDTYIVEAIGQLLSERLDNVFILPSIYYTPADTTEELQGTISVNFEATSIYIESLCHSLIRNGFRKIVALNIHGRTKLWLPQVAAKVFAHTGVPLLYLDPYLCFQDELDSVILGNMDNAAKETTLLAGALMILNKMELVKWAELKTEVFEKPEPLQRLLKVGQIGYCYNNPSGHIPERGDIDPRKGKRYLAAVAARLADIFGDLDDYWQYLSQAPRPRKSGIHDEEN